MNEILIMILQAWVNIFLMFYKAWGVVCGVCLIMIWQLRQTRFYAVFVWPAAISFLIPFPLLAALPEMTQFVSGRRVTPPVELWYWFVGGLMSPLLGMLLLSRFGGQLWTYIVSIFTKPLPQQRTGRTDIRTVSEILPDPLDNEYDPEKYFNSGKGVFLGLNEHQKPIYLPAQEWRSSHCQIVGTTGAGKNVIAGVLLAQAVEQGGSVVVIDPKDDEYFPTVMATIAKKSGVPFVYLDLVAQKAQWNPFAGKTEQESEELLASSFRMASSDSDGDVYRTLERRILRRFAKFCSHNPGPMHKQFSEFFAANQDFVQKAVKLHADLEELVFTPSAQATNGIDLSGLLSAGAVIYVRGSVRNPRIVTLQKIFLLSCLQIIESRDRSKARHVSIFLDEFKHMLSRPAMDAMGTIRDKKAHLIIAHQSLGDLDDCGNDLTPKSVIGAVVDNCAIKFAYKARSPETASWLSSLSGTILVDDETRAVETNLGLTEKQSGRTLRQAERPLIDVNQLLMLPKRTAVLFGFGCAQFIYTSPIIVDRSAFNIEAVGEDVHPSRPNSSLAGDLLDVD